MTIERFTSESEWIGAALAAALDAVRKAVRKTAGDATGGVAKRVEGSSRFRAAGSAPGPIRFCLAGGATPEPLYAALARDPEFEEACAGEGHMSSLELWIGDERQVPPDVPVRNAVMIARAFAPALSGGAWKAPATLIPWPDLPAAQAATVYASRLLAVAGDPPEFDFLILGMGADGHVAGLFPGDPAALESSAYACAAHAPSEPKLRMTLTFPVFAAARSAIIFARGRDKAEVVESLSGRMEKGDTRGGSGLPVARLAEVDIRLLYLE